MCFRRRPSKLDPFRDYLWMRWQSGCHNARQLYDELVSQGYSGSRSDVKRFVSQAQYRCRLPHGGEACSHPASTALA